MCIPTLVFIEIWNVSIQTNSPNILTNKKLILLKKVKLNWIKTYQNNLWHFSHFKMFPKNIKLKKLKITQNHENSTNIANKCPIMQVLSIV